MSHANAALTPRARLRLAKLVVDDQWPATVAAKMFMVSPITARKWVHRYRAEGAAGMVDPFQPTPVDADEDVARGREADRASAMAQAVRPRSDRG